MAEVFDFGLQQHKIKMDGKFFENNLFAVAGDTGRRLEVQLLDSDNLVQNTTGISLRLNADVAGQATYAEATLIDATKGLYELDLPNGMLLAPGNWQFQWQIIGASGEKLHSFAFTGSVGSNLSEGSSEATNFYLNANELKQMQEDLVNGTFNSEVLETKITEKLTNLETQYAPKLTEVTARFAQTASQNIYSFSNPIVPSFTKIGEVFNNVQADIYSIYWCYVVNVEGKISNPLGKYYMFYSTDHGDIDGHIRLAYSNSPKGSWTNYGKVFQHNTDMNTETPSVLWDNKNERFLLYYHINETSTDGQSQTTRVAYSTNCLTWTKVGQVFDIRSSEFTGDHHSGYFMPFKFGQQFMAYSLFGGGDRPRFALSYSMDGLKWDLDPRLLAYQFPFTGDSNNFFVSWNHSIPFMFGGMVWLIGINTNFTSGSTAKNANVDMVRVSPNLRTILSEPTRVFQLDSTGESNNVRATTLFSEKGKLYLYYQCDNKLFCAICEGGNQ